MLFVIQEFCNLTAFRAGSGVSPTRHGAWATPLTGHLQGKKKKRLKGNRSSPLV